jgi:tripartite ATP-independent transporter DctM subunit
MDAPAALIGIGIMLVLLLLRMPVSFALLATGFFGIWYKLTPDAAYHAVSADIWGQLSSYSLAAVPMFILMGQITFRAGISERLFEAAYRWIGSLPGGVAATTILASIGFSAICGSNAATTATMGTAALPKLKDYGYSRSMSGGAIAIGGTLGVVIPPSTALIIVAFQTEQSITQLFVTALLPGLLVGVLLVLTVLLVCLMVPRLGPPGPRASWTDRFASLGGVVEALLLFALVIGGLYLGWFTPSEAGAVGAFGAIVIAVARRNLTPRVLWQAVQESLRLTAMVILLIAGAVVFGTFLTVTRVPSELAGWAADLPVPPVGVLTVILLIYLVGGALMDALGFLVLSLPIFFPVVVELGYDPAWFTIVIVLVTTLGAVTPPVGINVYIVSALDRDMDVISIFRGVSVFFATYALAIGLLVALLTLVPLDQVSTWLSGVILAAVLAFIPLVLAGRQRAAAQERGDLTVAR